MFTFAFYYSLISRIKWLKGFVDRSSQAKAFVIYSAFFVYVFLFSGVFYLTETLSANPLELDPRMDDEDEEDCLIHHGYAGSLHYAFSASTTIGFGQIVPCSTAGRIVTLGYSLIGLPYTVFLLGDIGGHMCTFLCWLITLWLKYLLKPLKKWIKDSEIENIMPIASNEQFKSPKESSGLLSTKYFGGLIRITNPVSVGGQDKGNNESINKEWNVSLNDPIDQDSTLDIGKSDVKPSKHVQFVDIDKSVCIDIDEQRPNKSEQVSIYLEKPKEQESTDVTHPNDSLSEAQPDLPMWLCFTLTLVFILFLAVYFHGVDGHSLSYCLYYAVSLLIMQEYEAEDFRYAVLTYTVLLSGLAFISTIINAALHNSNNVASRVESELPSELVRLRKQAIAEGDPDRFIDPAQVMQDLLAKRGNFLSKKVMSTSKVESLASFSQVSSAKIENEIQLEKAQESISQFLSADPESDILAKLKSKVETMESECQTMLSAFDWQKYSKCNFCGLMEKSSDFFKNMLVQTAPIKTCQVSIQAKVKNCEKWIQTNEESEDETRQLYLALRKIAKISKTIMPVENQPQNPSSKPVLPGLRTVNKPAVAGKFDNKLRMSDIKCISPQVFDSGGQKSSQKHRRYSRNPKSINKFSKPSEISAAIAIQPDAAISKTQSVSLLTAPIGSNTDTKHDLDLAKSPVHQKLSQTGSSIRSFPGDGQDANLVMFENKRNAQIKLDRSEDKNSVFDPMAKSNNQISNSPNNGTYVRQKDLKNHVVNDPNEVVIMLDSSRSDGSMYTFSDDFKTQPIPNDIFKLGTPELEATSKRTSFEQQKSSIMKTHSFEEQTFIAGLSDEQSRSHEDKVQANSAERNKPNVCFADNTEFESVECERLVDTLDESIEIDAHEITKLITDQEIPPAIPKCAKTSLKTNSSKRSRRPNNRDAEIKLEDLLNLATIPITSSQAYLANRSKRSSISSQTSVRSKHNLSRSSRHRHHKSPKRKTNRDIGWKFGAALFGWKQPKYYKTKKLPITQKHGYIEGVPKLILQEKFEPENEVKILAEKASVTKIEEKSNENSSNLSEVFQHDRDGKICGIPEIVILSDDSQLPSPDNPEHSNQNALLTHPNIRHGPDGKICGIPEINLENKVSSEWDKSPNESITTAYRSGSTSDMDYDMEGNIVGVPPLFVETNKPRPNSYGRKKMAGSYDQEPGRHITQGAIEHTGTMNMEDSGGHKSSGNLPIQEIVAVDIHRPHSGVVPLSYAIDRRISGTGTSSSAISLPETNTNFLEEIQKSIENSVSSTERPHSAVLTARRQTISDLLQAQADGQPIEFATAIQRILDISDDLLLAEEVPIPPELVDQSVQCRPKVVIGRSQTIILEFANADCQANGPAKTHTVQQTENYATSDSANQIQPDMRDVTNQIRPESATVAVQNAVTLASNEIQTMPQETLSEFAQTTIVELCNSQLQTETTELRHRFVQAIAATTNTKSDAMNPKIFQDAKSSQTVTPRFMRTRSQTDRSRSEHRAIQVMPETTETSIRTMELKLHHQSTACQTANLVAIRSQTDRVDTGVIEVQTNLTNTQSQQSQTMVDYASLVEQSKTSQTPILRFKRSRSQTERSRSEHRAIQAMPETKETAVKALKLKLHHQSTGCQTAKRVAIRSQTDEVDTGDIEIQTYTKITKNQNSQTIIDNFTT